MRRPESQEIKTAWITRTNEPARITRIKRQPLNQSWRVFSRISFSRPCVPGELPTYFLLFMFMFLMLFCSNSARNSHFSWIQLCDGRTDGRTDEGVSYRDARRHLKRESTVCTFKKRKRKRNGIEQKDGDKGGLNVREKTEWKGANHAGDRLFSYKEK